MVPKPGEPGSETWPADGEAWQRGGANCWVTPTYDPELDLLYQGTGNPAPDFDGGVRAGRQPLHRQRRRGGREHRRDPVALPVHPARPVGLRLHDGEPPVRGSGRAQAARARGQERVLLRPRPDRRRAGPRVPRSSTGSPGARSPPTARSRPRSTRTRRASRCTSGRVRPAARSGRTCPTAPRPGCSTSRCRTSGPPPPAGAGSSRRASRTGARASPWTSRTLTGT